MKETSEDIVKHVLEQATSVKFNLPSLERTPERWVNALYEMTLGYGSEPAENVVLFPTVNDEMVVISNIEYFSLCEHHVLPFFGRATVGYIPNANIIGASKIPRIVNCFARRLQTQEQLADDIANFLSDCSLLPKGVGVHLVGQHMCMMARGVKQSEAIMHTTALRGNFKNADVKMEFLSYRNNGVK